MKLIRKHPVQTLSLLLALIISTAAGADTAGSVIFAKGAVTAERLPPVTLTKGDAVLTEDTIVTGAGARAQLLMIDGAKIAIRPDSRLKIEEYVYAKSASSGASASISTTRDRSVTSLIKGGFRTITGAIGKADETAYEVRTPVGVLGIRGTDYTAVFCRGDCAAAPGVGPGDPLEDGLYLGVIAGTIFFRNEFGEFDIAAGEYAFISLSDRTLRQLADPAAVFFDSYDLTAVENEATKEGQRLRFDGELGRRRTPDKAALEDDGSENSEQEESAAPAQPVLGVDPDGNPIDITPGEGPPQSDRTIGFSVGSLGPQATPLVGVLDNSPDQYQTDDGNNIVGFAGAYPPDTNSVVPIARSGDYGIGTNTLSDTGFDSLTVLRWGRWSGGTVDITLGNGSDASQDLGNQSLHWISGPENGIPVMPILGAVSYSLVGATSPTDNFGNTGVLGDASFSADFTRQIVTSDLSLVIGGSTWNATGTGTMGAAGNVVLAPHLFIGNYSSVDVDGIAGGTGAFSGFFSDPGPSSRPDVPGGVGLTYTLRDERGTTEVSGAAAFGNPQ